MTIATRSVGAIAVALGLFAAGGCGRAAQATADAGKMFMMAQDLGSTVTQSSADHLHSINAVIDKDMRAFFEDLDLLYQTDRLTRLTRWHEQ